MSFVGLKKGRRVECAGHFRLVRYQVAFLPFAMTAGTFAWSYMDSVIPACETSFSSAQSWASCNESKRVEGLSSWPSGSQVISSWTSSCGLRTILGRSTIRTWCGASSPICRWAAVLSMAFAWAAACDLFRLFFLLLRLQRLQSLVSMLPPSSFHRLFTPIGDQIS